MNCVQCGEELPASAKFCKKCGCKVEAAVPAAALAAVSRGIPVASAPAYTTCPDCGALCKGNARFCGKCGCRFEQAASFEETRRDNEDPLSPEEEKAILVFGNVQDSSGPAPERNGERIDTSPAMVIGGSAASAVAAAPSLRTGAQAEGKLGNDWLVASKTAAPAAPVVAAPLAQSVEKPVKPASSSTPEAKPRRSSTERNPMPQAPATESGTGKWIALGALTLAVLAGGGAWWWKGQQQRKAPPVDRPAASAPAAPIEPAHVPAALPAEAVLAPNESIAPPQVEAVPAADTVVAVPTEAAPPIAEAAPARPAPRKPARKQTLDDLLN